jgi:hypothetical protein
MSRPPRESDDLELSSIQISQNEHGGEKLKACRSDVYIRETKVFFKIKKSLVDAWRVSDMFARGVAVA